MKKLILALSLFAVAMPAASVAVAQPSYGNHDRHDDDRRDGDHDYRTRDWRHDRREWRDERQQARWDSRRHDGYWYNDQWHYGQPPRMYYGRPGFSLGYRSWERGAHLPRYYFNNRYYVDYRRYHLRAPPRGYHWVRDERGDFVLAAIATGIIADIIINSR